MIDPYIILEVSKDATEQQIKKAYQKLTIKYHPSKKTGDIDYYFKVRAAYESITKKLSFADQYNKFKDKYLDSDEELSDLMKLYNKHKGNLKKIIDDHILNEYKDEDRLRVILDKMICDKKIRKFKQYEKLIPEKLKKSCKEDVSALIEVMSKNDEKKRELIAKLEQKYCNQIKE